MSSASFVASDNAPSLLGTLTNDDGTPYNLAGATVRFQMHLEGAYPFKVNAVAVIVDAATGSVRYDWASGDLDTPGTYVARWRIVAGGATQHTIPADEVIVEAQ